MEGLLIRLLRCFARPRQAIPLDSGALRHLDARAAQILVAVAEGIIGPDFLEKVPRFVPTFDAYLSSQRPQARRDLLLGLLLVENPLVTLWLARRLTGFSHLSIPERQLVLARLKASRREALRRAYVAFRRIGASAYYGSEANWSDIHYPGVSADHPELLTVPRWRPDDPTPIER